MNTIETTKFIEWFNVFLSEKNIPYISFEIIINEQTHFIDNTYVFELIRAASPEEQKIIKNYLVRLDFANADINDYLKHLAKSYLLEHY